MPFESKVHSSISARDVSKIEFDAQDCQDLQTLQAMGIGLDEATVEGMMSGIGMDAIQGTTTTASISTPVQFLQAWLPGHVKINFAARNIDMLVGRDVVGSWEDEEIVQPVLENTGKAVPYGDYTNVPLASWNQNFERRTIVRFEEGMRVSVLEDKRAAKARVDNAATKRESAALNLEIQRNAVGFSGYNSGANRTYGFLNDPSLSSYVTVATGTGGGTEWSGKTFLEITADIRTSVATLRNQSKDTIDPEKVDITLAIATGSVDYLSVTSDFGISVRQWIKETYPRMRIVSAPELNAASGGDNVFYLYAEKVDDNSTDGGKTWVHANPSIFQVLGTERLAKGYQEDYSNATAGVMLKRPYAVVRYDGI